MRGGGAIMPTDAITPPPRGRAALKRLKALLAAPLEGRTNVRGQRSIDQLVFSTYRKSQ
jgi:hypothetical protein